MRVPGVKRPRGLRPSLSALAVAVLATIVMGTSAHGVTWSAPIDVGDTQDSLAGSSLNAAMSSEGAYGLAARTSSKGSRSLTHASVGGGSGNSWGNAVALSAAGQSTSEAKVAISFGGSNWLVQASSNSAFGATWSAATTVSATGSGQRSCN